MSICSDKVEGGARLMTYTGNTTSKVSSELQLSVETLDMIHLQVNYKGSSFHVDFFQLQDPNDFESGRVWEQRVAIMETQLHTVGQHLGWYTEIRAANDPSVFTITEKAPIRAFSWLKVPSSVLFQRHY